jgi:hypothetical protein
MKLLFTGSRKASPELLAKARETVMYNMFFDNDEIIVGDADGVDTIVIDTCDEFGYKVTVFGSYNRVRHKTKTGTNVPTGLTYLGRDRLMANLCDKCFAFCFQKSRGTMYTYNYTLGLGKKGTLIE